MAGYSDRPLVGKLGFKPGQRALLLGVPDDLPEILGFGDFAVRHMQPAPGAEYDVIMIFETARDALAVWSERLPELLHADGMVWIAWPKKASRRPTTLSEDAIRAVLLPLDLVDVKVCAIDKVWSGLKLVVRRALRAQWSAPRPSGES